MKTFIYKVEKGTRSRRTGSFILTFTVYEIKKNIPNYIGQCTASSGSYKGDSSTVMNYIAEMGKIKPKFKEGYSYREDAKKEFKLIEI